MKAIGISYTLLVLLAGSLIGQEAKFDPKHDALLRGVRIYGDNETLPPVLVLNNSSGYSTNIGSEKITVELDIFANVPPNLYARFVHCTADWKETENIFYQELYHRRFSNIRWDVAGYTNPFFSHRGYFTFPDFSIPIKYSGNWKVKFYSYDDDKDEFAEAKFFVVEPRAQASMSIWNSMYSTKYNVSSTSYNFDVQVWSKLNL
ncbi:MAG: type IX secretion system plug protein domain-containing protein, partial [Bacteroidales bacterium]